MPSKNRYKLTKIQKETLEFVQKYKLANKVSPTLMEMAKSLGVSSPQTIADRLMALRKKGVIKQSAHGWRNIELVENSNKSNRLIQIPVVASVGADQASVFAEQEYGNFLQIEETLLLGHRDIVAMRVIGESMRDAGIFNGDYIFIEDNEHFVPQNGDVVVATVEGMTVVKEFYRGRNAIELRPKSRDPKYSPIIINTEQEDFKIIGRLINTLHFSDSNDDDFQFINE
jgi:repressor LexA